MGFLLIIFLLSRILPIISQIQNTQLLDCGVIGSVPLDLVSIFPSTIEFNSSFDLIIGGDEKKPAFVSGAAVKNLDWYFVIPEGFVVNGNPIIISSGTVVSGSGTVGTVTVKTSGKVITMTATGTINDKSSFVPPAFKISLKATGPEGSFGNVISQPNPAYSFDAVINVVCVAAGPIINWASIKVIPIVKPGYSVVFFDDFDGEKLDSKFWTAANNVTHCSPCELQLYLEKNVEVKDGFLTLHTLKESVVAPNNNAFDYTSGWISAKDKMSHLYGFFEVRARLPSPRATGAWPAHWLLPQSSQCWPTGGEIDIMEATSNPSADNGIFGSYRWGTECGKDEQIAPGAQFPPPGEARIDFSEDFHLFAAEWNETAITFSVDGIEYETKDADEVILPSAPMYLILNTAIAPYFPPGRNAVYPTKHVIDWVRISQRRQSP